MDKHKDLSDHDEGQIVMAKQLGQSISQKEGLVGCSQYAVVSTYKSNGCPRFTDEPVEQRLVHLIRSHKIATGSQITEKVNAGYDRIVCASQFTGDGVGSCSQNCLQ